MGWCVLAHGDSGEWVQVGLKGFDLAGSLDVERRREAWGRSKGGLHLRSICSFFGILTSDRADRVHGWHQRKRKCRKCRFFGCIMSGFSEPACWFTKWKHGEAGKEATKGPIT